MLKNNKGFSLIEVLVTVGLIGILVGIAVPSYNKYKKNTIAMAMKADVGNGGKAYAAWDAVEGDFCATLDKVGITLSMTGTVYRKQGFYGFSSAHADCGGTPSSSHNSTTNVLQYKNTGVCLKDSDGTKHAATTSGTCPTAHTWKTENEYGGTDTACILAADNFDLGAYTNTSNLDTFIMVNEAGKVHQVTGDTCIIVP